MRRQSLLQRLASTAEWDLVVIGGGATGLGVAVDAAARGFSVALVEAHDFAKGTSSRTSKLVHGGVRYLAQGNIGLVRTSLRERATLLRNAPHLAQPIGFVMPAHAAWERMFYGAGLKLYDALAGKSALGDTVFLNRARTLDAVPALRAEGLRGGVKYWDGQFDDARLAIALARTAERLGACVANYMPAISLVRDQHRIAGVRVQDVESGRRFELKTRCVVNAAGVWVDEVRRLDESAAGRLVRASQGVHLVVDRSLFPGDHALTMPRTADGRILFAIPWLGKTLLGTTDTADRELSLEPRPLAAEIDFILDEAGRWLARAPSRSDVRSAWVGLRPLVMSGDAGDRTTKSLSREHVVTVSRHGLVTVTGGKWTTYRAMAEDVLEECFRAGLLARRAGGVTADLPLVGASATGVPISAPPGLHLYGSEAEEVAALPGTNRELAPGFTEAMVRFAARHEHARTVEDVLARRSRLLFLDANLAASLARAVAAILVEEIEGFDAAASAYAFEQLAASYQLTA